MTTPNCPTKATSISEEGTSNNSQISGGSAWMNVALIEELMEVYRTLTFTAQEIQWVLDFWSNTKMSLFKLYNLLQIYSNTFEYPNNTD